MRNNYSVVKVLSLLLIFKFLYEIYKFYQFYTLRSVENFSTRLQDGRSRNKFHPVNIRARFRKWKRTKPFHGKIKQGKRLANEILWKITGNRKTF